MGSLKLTLKIWRQRSAKEKGFFETHQMDNVSTDMSFLEMLDILNDKLEREAKEPVIFDHDCVKAYVVCVAYSFNGQPHGPEKATTTCQLHMRTFKDGETITIEPWRASAFPSSSRPMVDRSAFDRIIQAGGYTSAKTGSAPEANIIPIRKRMQTWLWMLPLASAVVLVLRHVKMLLQVYLLS